MSHDVKALLRFANNVARRISRDPESESAAGNALARALRTYDGRVSIYGWITVCVRREVWGLLRKRYHPHRKQFGPIGQQRTNFSGNPQYLLGDTREYFDTIEGRETEPEVCPIREILGDDADLVFDRYVNERSYANMAADRGMNWYQLRLKLNGAVSRLRESQWAQQWNESY